MPTNQHVEFLFLAGFTDAAVGLYDVTTDVLAQGDLPAAVTVSASAGLDYYRAQTTSLLAGYYTLRVVKAGQTMLVGRVLLRAQPGVYQVDALTGRDYANPSDVRQGVDRGDGVTGTLEPFTILARPPVIQVETGDLDTIYFPGDIIEILEPDGSSTNLNGTVVSKLSANFYSVVDGKGLFVTLPRHRLNRRF